MCGQIRPFFQVFQQEYLLDGQQHKIVQAPADKVPVGAVPDAGQRPDHQHVEQLPGQPAAVAAQRDVDVIPEPGRQRDVPPPPKLGDAGGNVRQVKVGGAVKAHHPAQAVAHLRVAGKIKVQLERVSQDAQPGQRRRDIGKAHVRRQQVAPQRADGIGQDHLFGQAEHKHLGTGFDLGGAAAVFDVVQRGGQVPVLDDGPQHQLREQHHIGGKGDGVALRLRPAGVDVGNIADELKDIVADAQRQYVQKAQR